MWRRSTGGPGQGVDHALIARRRVDSRQRVCVPDLDSSVKTGSGQQVRVVRLKFAVKDRLDVTLEKHDREPNHSEVQPRNISQFILLGMTDGFHGWFVQYQVSEEVPLFGAHVVESDASVHEAANGLAGGQREGLVL